MLLFHRDPYAWRMDRRKRPAGPVRLICVHPVTFPCFTRMNRYNNQVLDKRPLLLYDNSRTVHCITFIFYLNERGISMKRRDFLKLSAAAALAGAAAACGAAPAASASSAQASSLTASSASSAASAASSAASASAQAAGSRTLVACYSATGNTAAVAGYIADATGADLFLVQPVDPYTDEELNYNDRGSRVSQEHADPALQTVELEATTPDGWADYDPFLWAIPSGGGRRAGHSTALSPATTLRASGSSPSAPRPVRAWAAAPKTWPSWPVRATGRKGCGSAPRPALRM